MGNLVLRFHVVFIRRYLQHINYEVAILSRFQGIASDDIILFFNHFAIVCIRNEWVRRALVKAGRN